MAPKSTPVAEAPEEAAVDSPVETENLSDDEILARIQAEIAARQANQPTSPRRATLQEVFDQSVALVAAATGKRFRSAPQVSEQTAVKILELTMMWALNNRDTTSGEIIPTEELGGPADEPTGPANIDEIIGDTAAETE